MRIQHNITAMNSYRNFATNNSMLSKNLEKLSSGYKVNRAGDDAAGLAISEKMRAQITGLEGATKNAKDGISLIQAAEGALTEVHSMLNRMTTLAEQSANGTYDNDVDRFQLQKEIQALKDEIDRIADSTNYNGIKLLDGSLASNASSFENAEKQIMTIKGTTVAGAANTSATVATSFAEVKGDTFKFSLSTSAASSYAAFTFNFTDKDGKTHTLSVATNDKAGANGDIADQLNGTATGKLELSFLSNDENQKEALKIFRETFDVASTDGKAFEIKVKAGHEGAELQSAFGNGSGTSVDAARQAATPGDANAKALAITKEDGMAAGLVITLGGKGAAGERIQIGDKIYELVTGASDKPKSAGATAVVIGGTLSATTKNLLAALKADGYDVALEDGTGVAGKIRFKNLEQISEMQSGGAVSVSSTNLAVRDQEATKQSTKLKIGANATADGQTMKVSISYIDADGKNQSKEISFTASKKTAADIVGDLMNALKDDPDIGDLFEFKDNGDGSLTMTARSTDNTKGQIGSITVSSEKLANAGADTGFNAAVSAEITAGVNDGKAIELRDDGKNVSVGDTVTINGKTFEFAATSSAEVGKGNVRVLVGSSGKESMENLSKLLSENGIKNSYDSATGKIVFSDRDNIPESTTSGGLTLQIGDTAHDYNKMTVSVDDMHIKNLGLDALDISTQDGAAAALDLIKSAINQVSDTRGGLGALQNRLDHTINNLGVMRENIQNAESLIRDTDVAEEMMAYTKNSILNQSAQAMLAQANQLPQGVLQLLG